MRKPSEGELLSLTTLLTMTSATPELKAIYSSSLNQIIGGHSALTELAINRKWASPYDAPAQQLAMSFSKSETTVKASK